MAVVLGTNSGFVTVAPTADPAGTGATIDGNCVVTKHTSPAGATKITSIGWYRASGTNTANWEIALFSDGAGVPVTRLFVDATNSTASNGWLTTAVDWDISPSTPYWLALQMDTHSGSSSVDSAASGGAGSDVFAASTIATPYAGGAVADADGMYAIYALVAVPADFPGTGALASQAAAVAAAGLHGRTSSGALTAQASAVAGTGTVGRTATGALQMQSAGIAGEGTAQGAPEDFDATGGPAAQAAALSGAGTVGRAGDGTLVIGDASIIGAGYVNRTASGALVAQAAAISGEGTSDGGEEPALPVAGAPRFLVLRRLLNRG